MKKLLLLLLCLTLGISILLTSCSKDGEGEENAEEDGENGDNQEDQGKNPDSSENKNECAKGHTGNIICEKCFTPIYTSNYKLPTSDSWVINVKSFSIKIDDVSASGSATVTAENAALSLTLDENGRLIGSGTAKLVYTLKNNNRTKVMDTKAYVFDDMLYLLTEGDHLGNKEGALDAGHCIEIEKVDELRYAYHLLTSTVFSDGGFDKINNLLSPFFKDVSLDTASGTVIKNTAKFINSIFTVTKNSDGTAVISLNTDALKAYNRALFDNKLYVIFDKIAGEGSFEKLEKLAENEKLYDFTVADLLNHLKTEEGVDVTALLNAIDTLSEEMLGENLDLNDFLNDEKVLGMSVKDALKIAMSTETPENAVAKAKETLAGLFTFAKENTAYDLIAENLAKEQGESVTADEAFLQFDGIIANADGIGGLTLSANAAKVITKINLAARVVTDDFSISLNLDVSGKVVTLVLDASDDYLKDLGYIMTVTENKITVITNQLLEDETDIRTKLELVPGGNVVIDTEHLAAVKARLDTAKRRITAEGVYSVLKESDEKNQSNPRNTLLDPKTGLVYNIQLRSFGLSDSEEYPGRYKVNYHAEVLIYDVKEIFAYSVNGEGESLSDVTPVFNVKVVSYYGTTYANDGYDYNEVGYAEILSAITLTDMLSFMTESGEDSGSYHIALSGQE